MKAQTIANARPAAVAGLFYPAARSELAALAKHYLEGLPAGTMRPQALIVPHAGWIYSGAIAAQAYRLLETWKRNIKRVVLAGPPHRVAVDGIAVSPAQSFTTPLGQVPLDRDYLDQLVASSHAVLSETAHSQEHCLEVQLPFLQTVLNRFTVAPLLIGQIDAETLAAVFKQCLDGDTLIIISTDLSHYHHYHQAQRIDARTNAAILARDDSITADQACGYRALNGLLNLAQQLDWQVQLLSQCNSGDSAGDHQHVVGYAAYACYG